MTIFGGITREGRSVFMILVLDVGNTNIVMGVYDNARLLEHWRIATDREKTADEYGILLNNLFEHSPVKKADIETVVISSVVPPVMPTLERMCAEYLNQSPLVVGPGIKTGISIKYDNPKEVGADRIVNAVAAYEKYSGPVIIVDFGTATTFCAVSRAGEYLGGAIAPGIGISTEALFSRAAKLPRIELVKPRNVICKNTVSSMQSGIIYGFVGQVDYIVQKMAQEMAQEIGDKPKVVATGGLADLIFQESSSLDIVDPYLTLEGLRIIYQRNRDAKKV